MLGKNRGKTRRYKNETTQAADPGTPGLERPISTLSLVNLADHIGAQMFHDVMDCMSILPNVDRPLISHPAVALNAKKLIFPLGSFIRFEKADKTWFEPLFFDALYLHTMAFSAYTYLEIISCRRNLNSAREADNHFIKSVGLLRKRLLIEGDQAISDLTLLVVLSMAIHAIMSADLASASHHLQGLRKLLNLRGGLISVTRPKFLLETFRHGPSFISVKFVPHTDSFAGATLPWLFPQAQRHFSSKIASWSRWFLTQTKTCPLPCWPA